MELPPGLRRLAAQARRFRTARPFPHAVIDGFLEEADARALLDQFPPYDAAAFRNAHGQQGKAVHPDLRALGPAFVSLDRLARSRPWLSALSRLTRIEDLRYDPAYRGGGAQENRPGMRLWPHIDFNFHKDAGWRRLNLLLYLNPGWRPSAGGRLLLHSGPRARPAVAVEPRFNRCVVFETSERSWHSVEPVRGDAPRRSVSLYLYTRRRPEGSAAPHHTVWELPGLPRRARAGAPLDEALLAAIRRCLTLHDCELSIFRPLEKGDVVPADWAPGRRLSDADAAWLRGQLRRRRRELADLWRPFRAG